MNSCAINSCVPGTMGFHIKRKQSTVIGKHNFLGARTHPVALMRTVVSYFKMAVHVIYYDMEWKG